MLFDIEMETSANVLAAVRLPANGSAQISLRGYLKGDAADKKLYGKASAAGNVYVTDYSLNIVEEFSHGFNRFGYLCL